MANGILRKIMKYKWILASILVIFLFFHFMSRMDVMPIKKMTTKTSSNSSSGKGQCSCMS